jgi:hypothetical protein
MSRVMIASVAVGLIFCSVLAARADVVNWTNTNGGVFSESGN